jgi:hypothetical protein
MTTRRRRKRRRRERKRRKARKERKIRRSTSVIGSAASYMKLRIRGNDLNLKTKRRKSQRSSFPSPIRNIQR